jgi:hypothetical protein
MKDKVTILYKSGQKVHVKVDRLVVNRNFDGPVKLEWENMVPRPLSISGGNIESIWEGWI